MTDASPSCFTRFRSSTAAIPLPAQFTFPFYYEPHELSRLAAQELQERLKTEDFQHNFGAEGDPEGRVIGKMFGVLVVKNRLGELGYLSGFSGKMGNSNHHPGFVPPVFDMLEKGNFFLEGMKDLKEINQKVRDKESSEAFLSMQSDHEALEKQAEAEIEALREEMRTRKRLRKGKTGIAVARYECHRACDHRKRTDSGKSFLQTPITHFGGGVEYEKRNLKS